MIASAFLNLLSIGTGFVAGLYFCLGSASLGASQIETLSATYCDASPPLAKFLIELKADYLCGGLLLCITFVLQFLANGTQHFFNSSAKWFADDFFATGVAFFSSVIIGGIFYGYRWWILRMLYQSVPIAQIDHSRE